MPALRSHSRSPSAALPKSSRTSIGAFHTSAGSPKEALLNDQTDYRLTICLTKRQLSVEITLHSSTALCACSVQVGLSPYQAAILVHDLLERCESSDPKLSRAKEFFSPSKSGEPTT